MWPLQSIIIYAAMAAASFGAGWSVNGWRHSANQAATEQAQVEADRLARRAADQKITGVDDEHQQRLRASAAAAGRLRNELDRLREQLAQAGGPSEQSCAGSAARAARAEQLLGSCASRYSEVARDAQLYADQLRGWQQLFGPED